MTHLVRTTTLKYMRLNTEWWEEVKKDTILLVVERLVKEDSKSDLGKLYCWLRVIAPDGKTYFILDKDLEWLT